MYIKKEMERIDWSHCSQAYLNDLNRVGRRISPQKEAWLFYQYEKTMDDSIKEQIINANLLFVVKIAKMYRGNGLSIEDLISEGNMGLLKAFDKFDHTRGFKLITFAVNWIQAYILKALSEKNSTIKIPIGMREFISKMKKESKEFHALNERYPTPEELSEILNEDLDKIILLQSISKGCISFDFQQEREGEYSLLDVIPDYRFKADEIFDDELSDYRFEKLIECLIPKHKMILRKHFSNDFDNTTCDILKMLGKDLNDENFRKLYNTKNKIIEKLKNRYVKIRA